MNNSTAPKPPCCCANQDDNVKTESALLKTKRTADAFSSIAVSVLIAFFPKCPACWAVYMSMFGSIGLAQLPYMGWMLPVLTLFLCLHLFILYKRAPIISYTPFFLSLCGAIIILVARASFPAEKWLLFTGMFLIISGSLINSVSSILLPYFSLNKSR